MIKLFTILVAVLITSSVFAQSPEKMSYQAVVRNIGGVLMANQAVGIKISILQGTPAGTLVYQEIYNPNPQTNANGLVSIEIGGGIPMSGTFSSIDWSAGPYFLKTETDPAGGTNYTITGTSQLLSVPYALHAKSAETITGGITEVDPVYSGSQASNITAIDITNLSNLSGTNTGDQDLSGLATKTQLGDSIALVRSEMPDVTGLATTTAMNTALADKVDKVTGKGLSTEDYTTAEKTKLAGLTLADGSETKLSAGTNVTITGSGTTGNPYVINVSSGGGETHYLGEEYLGGIIFYLYTGSDGTQHGLVVSKTESIATWGGSTLVGADKTSNGAYNMYLMPTGEGTARTWVETLGAGWYLPSIDELSILWHNRFHVNNSSASYFTPLSTLNPYLSSTEYNDSNAFYFTFNAGYTGNGNKTLNASVRAVRAF